MEKQDLQELALRLSAFVEMLEKQATSVADNMAQSGQTMTRSARDIAGQVQQLSQSVVSTVRIESRGAVEAGAREGIAPALEQLQQTIRTLQGSSQSLHAQTKAMQGAQRNMMWLASFAVLNLVPHLQDAKDWKQNVAWSARLGTLGTAAPATIGGALLLVYKVALGLFIGFGPLFILCAGFKATMGLFSKWLYYGIGTLFSLAVLSLMFAIVTKISLAVGLASLVKYALLLQTPNAAEGINTIALQQGGIGLIMTILLISCPPITAMFFNATVGQFSAYSQFGIERGGGQRDANGNPVNTMSGAHANPPMGQNSKQTSDGAGNTPISTAGNATKPTGYNQPVFSENVVKPSGETHRGRAVS